MGALVGGELWALGVAGQFPLNMESTLAPSILLALLLSPQEPCAPCLALPVWPEPQRHRRERPSHQKWPHRGMTQPPQHSPFRLQGRGPLDSQGPANVVSGADVSLRKGRARVRGDGWGPKLASGPVPTRQGGPSWKSPRRPSLRDKEKQPHHAWVPGCQALWSRCSTACPRRA